MRKKCKVKFGKHEKISDFLAFQNIFKKTVFVSNYIYVKNIHEQLCHIMLNVRNVKRNTNLND